MNHPAAATQKSDRSSSSELHQAMPSRLMKIAERGLWASRWVMVLGVLANVLGAVMMVGVACYDFLHLGQLMYDILTTEATLTENRSVITLIMIEIVDGFLMAGVLFIFGFGLYELFISKLSVAKHFEVQGKILNVKSIDHLKAKLGNLILMILVVKFFYYTIGLEVQGIEEVAIYAGSVCLIGLALFLSHTKKSALKSAPHKEGQPPRY